jgi:hypothetical protein
MVTKFALFRMHVYLTLHLAFCAILDAATIEYQPFIAGLLEIAILTAFN